ncbi:hypothetical protein SB912_18990 [Pantoea sp. SIMBA_072]
MADDQLAVQVPDVGFHPESGPKGLLQGVPGIFFLWLAPEPAMSQ